MKVIKNFKIITVLFLLFVLSSPLFSQTTTTTTTDDGLGSIIKIMVAVIAFLVAIIMWLILAYSEKEKTVEESGFKKFLFMLSKRPSITEEEKLLLDHDYDGIKELNNKIPPWFMAIFYGTIIWTAFYLVDYHILGSGNVQEDEYAVEVQEAAMQREILNKSGLLVNEDNVTQLDDAASLATGKEIFKKNCVACHGQNGEGLVGPNFTDDYWIHGNKINDLFRTIKYGVPAKGMISWQSQLDPVQMQEVASYVLTLRGTNPPNQKEPQGNLYTY
jgi:cytochrome c oxidase cbb3-type subunit III